MSHNVHVIFFSHRHIRVQMYALDDNIAITGDQLASLIRSLNGEARSLLSELGFIVEVRAHCCYKLLQ